MVLLIVLVSSIAGLLGFHRLLDAEPGGGGGEAAADQDRADVHQHRDGLRHHLVPVGQPGLHHRALAHRDDRHHGRGRHLRSEDQLRLVLHYARLCHLVLLRHRQLQHHVFLKVGCSCSTAVERMPHNLEVVDSNPAGCWAFFNVSSFPLLVEGPSRRCISNCVL